MPAPSYKIHDAYHRPRRWRRIHESGARWCDAERQERLQLKTRIEGWIEQQTEPVLYRQGRRVDRLNQVRFRLDCHVKNLVLNCRIRGTNLRARVLQANQDDFGAVAVQAELEGKKEIFEIRPTLDTLASRMLLETRTDFQRTVESLIRRNFAKAQIVKSTVSSDLEHSLSGKFVRLQFRSGGSRWVAIAAGPEENQATIDGLLSNGLLWRCFLRQRGLAGQDTLLLLAPWDKLLVLKSRLAWISGASRNIRLMAIDSEKETLTWVDLADCGNLDTTLTRVQTYSDGKSVDDDERVRRVLGLAPEQITWSRSENRHSVAFRIRGLEFANLRLGTCSKLTFGLDEPIVVRTEADWGHLKETVKQILTAQSIPLRAGNSRYAPQPERWLETLLLRDIRSIDARLDPRFVYPQVPAFLGNDRGMIDILSVTREGRLVILELKVSEDIDLPMQGLDYWLRVRWHNGRNEFQTRGYFPGVTLSPLPPLLHFVCPQFRYHSSFPALAGHLDPSIPAVQVGINENWREGVCVLLRRPLTPAIG
jgi:predicted component of type VI protein secretion system